MGGVCSTHGRDEKYIQNSYRKAERKRPLGRSRRRCEDVMDVDLKETGWYSHGSGGVQWEIFVLD